jgi:leucyl/phenylalanyl-tRNA--protein transferase
MRKVLRSGRFTVSFNQEFEKVLISCATVVRKGHSGTWISPEMQRAYLKLHQLGLAKSWEVWEGKALVGGIYGIDLGHVFCGESMFHTVSNASKVAFIHVAQELEAKGYHLLDCQAFNPHLESLGAEEIPRSLFLQYLKKEDPNIERGQN